MSHQQEIVYIMGQLDFKIPKNNIQEERSCGQTINTAHLKLRLLHPPIIIDLRTENKKQNYLLSKTELEYFQTTQSNATLFIHGYNVDFGEFGQQISALISKTNHLCPTAGQVYYQDHSNLLNPSKSSLLKLKFTDAPATVWRDRQHLKNIFGHAMRYFKLTNDRLNGDGAHNWWLHIEYNLNKAAGFKGFNYYYQPKQPQYTRIINIAWSGSPASGLDYLAIQPIAEKASVKLVDLIKQLKDNHIKINIIAHSAGNIVLIKAMHLLGQQTPFKNCIENTFMWEAALPNTALSPKADLFDNSFTDFWQTEKAYLAAKKIHVLYSKHDNILGPIPLQLKINRRQYLVDKYFSPAGGRSNAKIALAIDTIDQVFANAGAPNAISSAYLLAQRAGVPLNALLNDQALRNNVYQRWQQKHANVLNSQYATQTLIQQIHVLKNDQYAMFNDLAVFIGLYYAIINDGLYDFLKKPNNQLKLAKFMLTAAPKQAALLSSKILTAVNYNFNYQHRRKVFAFINEQAKTISGYNYLQKLAHVFFDNQLEHLVVNINKKLPMVLHKVVDFMLHLPDKMNTQIECLNQNFYQYITSQPQHLNPTATQVGEEMAALMITIFNTPGTAPHPAMGYAGPLRGRKDSSMEKLIKQQKVIPVDQTTYLLHHSAMKIPSDEVFTKIYKDVIMGEKSYQLGHWG